MPGSGYVGSEPFSNAFTDERFLNVVDLADEPAGAAAIRPADRPARAKTAAHPPGVMCGRALRAETDRAERESGTARRKAFTPVPPRLTQAFKRC
jgi:hypothetical protein